jgi:hypothetical protein
MEYQKSARQGLAQRPDIVFHIPAEVSGAAVTENNYEVWALKPAAGAGGFGVGGRGGHEQGDCLSAIHYGEYGEESLAQYSVETAFTESCPGRHICAPGKADWQILFGGIEAYSPFGL